MKKILWILLLLPILVFANPIDDKCSENVIWGAPKLADDTSTQYMCKSAYAINLNYKTKVANYVVEHISPRELAKNVKRKNNFHEDPAVPKKFRVTLKDYAGEPYDRGHLAPAADFAYDKNIMSESFLLSNMMPQDSGNNRGIWSFLEGHVRDIAKGNGAYVITGTIFYPKYKTIGNGVGVPDEIYKIVVSGNKIEAYLFPNETIKSADIEKYRVSVLEIEKKTGIDYFPKIPAELKYLEQ